MNPESSQYLHWLPRVLGYGACAQFVLFGVPRKIGCRIRHDSLARFPLNSEPFMNYPG